MRVFHNSRDRSFCFDALSICILLECYKLLRQFGYHCVCSGFSQWYQWYTNNVQDFTNGTNCYTICTNGNANGTIGPPNGTIGAIGKPMVPLISQWYHWLPMVQLVKLPMVPLGEPRTEPLTGNIIVGQSHRAIKLALMKNSI